jgi:hypothetical protein
MNVSQIESRLTESFERTRPFVPLLVQRLALIYLLPMMAAVLISTLGSRLLLALLPEFPLSTATILILGVNLFILVKGWQYLEQRFGGTRLFLLYNVVSRIRRSLKRLIAQPSADPASVNALLQQLQQAEEGFIATAGTPQTL